jgi:hypothetical protein
MVPETGLMVAKKNRSDNIVKREVNPGQKGGINNSQGVKQRAFSYKPCTKQEEI